MLEDLIELVARIWHADSEIRNHSVFGDSEMDPQSRRFAAWLCGGTITMLVLSGGCLVVADSGVTQPEARWVAAP